MKAATQQLPTIVIDTREQRPFDFSFVSTSTSTTLPPTTRRKLDSGDYSLEGFTDQIAIERKSIPDLYGSIGRGRRRFERAIARLAALPYAAVVVEGDWLAVASEPQNGFANGLKPRTIFRTVVSWQQRYPTVHWWFCPHRQFAEVTTYRMLEMWWRRKLEEVRRMGREAGRELAGIAADGGATR